MDPCLVHHLANGTYIKFEDVTIGILSQKCNIKPSPMRVAPYSIFIQKMATGRQNKINEFLSNNLILKRRSIIKPSTIHGLKLGTMAKKRKNYLPPPFRFSNFNHQAKHKQIYKNENKFLKSKKFLQEQHNLWHNAGNGGWRHQPHHNE